MGALEIKEKLTEADKQSALRMSKLLSDVSADFKNYHFTILDEIENEEDVEAEQHIFYDHELKVMNLVDRLGRLVEIPFQAKPIAVIDLLRKRLDHVEKCYRTIKGEFDERGREMDTYALQIREERNEDLKSELTKITGELFSVEVPVDLEEKRATLERLLLNSKEDIRRLAGSKNKKPPLSASGVMGVSGVQLPRIEVPTFDGNLLNWGMFWEQFESTIHSKT